MKATGKDHARVNLALWGDDDFLDLTVDEQLLYLSLWTSPGLSYCGAGEWHSGRIANLAADWTRDRIERAAAGLSRNLFLIVDADTDEYLLRSWIKHDGLWRMPNMAVSVANARAELSSRMLRGVVVHEVRRLRDMHPESSSWKRDAVVSMLDQRSVDPAALDPFNPTSNPQADPCSNPQSDPSDTATPNPQSGPSPTPAPATATTYISPAHARDADGIGRLDVKKLVDALAEHLNHRGVRRPASLSQWHRQAKQILDDDHRPLNEALAVLRYSQTDPFWSKNILTMAKLREKYDQLRLAGEIEPAIDPEQLLAESWEAGRIGKICELTGWIPPTFRHPEDPTIDRDTALRDYARQVIDDHRDELLMRLREVNH